MEFQPGDMDFPDLSPRARLSPRLSTLRKHSTETVPDETPNRSQVPEPLPHDPHEVLRSGRAGLGPRGCPARVPSRYRAMPGDAPPQPPEPEEPGANAAAPAPAPGAPAPRPGGAPAGAGRQPPAAAEDEEAEAAAAAPGAPGAGPGAPAAAPAAARAAPGEEKNRAAAAGPGASPGRSPVPSTLPPPLALQGPVRDVLRR